MKFKTYNCLIILVLISSFFSLGRNALAMGRGFSLRRSKVTKPIPPATALCAATIKRHMNTNVGELDLTAKDLIIIIQGIIKHFSKSNDPITWEAARLKIFNNLLKKRLTDQTGLLNDFETHKSHYQATYGINDYQGLYQTLKTLADALTSLQNALSNTHMCNFSYLRRSFKSFINHLKAHWPAKLVAMIEKGERKTKPYHYAQLAVQIGRKPLA